MEWFKVYGTDCYYRIHCISYWCISNTKAVKVKFKVRGNNMEKQIKIRIYPDGHLAAEVQGVKGPKCLEFIPIVENLLDAKVIDAVHSQEYFETDVTELEEELINVSWKG